MSVSFDHRIAVPLQPTRAVKPVLTPAMGGSHHGLTEIMRFPNIRADALTSLPALAAYELVYRAPAITVRLRLGPRYAARPPRRGDAVSAEADATDRSDNWVSFLEVLR